MLVCPSLISGLTIKDFHNDILKTVYKQNFKKAIASYFKQISEAETEHLIIDLRDNQGGDIENGVFLLSYLLDKPFSIVKAYFKLKDNQLHTCKGPSLGQHKPQANTFKGKVYVLINGGSFSNSGIVSSCLKANDRAIFIGQETGGNPNVVNGFTKDITLPNTKIQVQVPCKQLVMTDKTKNTGHGLMPTVPIQANLTTILEDKDTVLEYTIDLIRKSH
jgi:C-terminal processing protease CtpA/Prc